jgi:hypothetical protein
MLTQPFVRQLEEANCILITGAGGGFDVFSGLPLFFALQASGKKVHLANVSFSLSRSTPVTGTKIGNHFIEVTARSKGYEYYFPEGYLAQWFCRKRMDTSIYCTAPATPNVLYQAFSDLQAKLEYDAIVLVDGGVDSIMKGDERKIGTPVEDACTVIAANKLNVKTKQLICLGFGAELDVCSASALETISDLIRKNAFLGSIALTKDMPEVKQFAEATKFVFYEMGGSESVICSSILSALDGHYGDYHQIKRTVGSQLWINPLMAFYWAFDAQKVEENILYIDMIRDALTRAEVSQAIMKFRSEHPLRAEPSNRLKDSIM